MGHDITVEGSMVGVADAIAAFQPDAVSVGAADLTVQQILDALPDEAARDRAVSAAARRPYANAAKVGDTKTVDGVTYVLQGDPPRWHRVDEFMVSEAITEAGTIAQEIDRLFNGGAVDRPALEAAVRAYVEKHGIPADNPELMTAASVDKTLYRLVGAVNRKGELSDVVLGRGARKIEGGFDTTAQVLALSSGEFSAAELAERLGREADEVEEQLAADARYAFLGGDRWTTMDTYLTGDLWPKLDLARAQLADPAHAAMKTKLEAQVAALEKAIDPKALDDVDFQLNSAFLPLEVIGAFFTWRDHESERANDWTKKQPATVITFANGVYTVTGGNQYGDSKLLDKYLNRSGIRKEEDLPKIEALNAEFKEWLCGSPYRDQVEELYNRKFRGYVAPEYSDEPMDVPGLNPDRTVRNWRWSSLRRSLAQGKGIVADDVGLGKAQPLDAKILTPTGWRLMGDIKVGDQVISVDGTPTTVLGVYPQGEKDIFRVEFHDGSSTECCDEHLWMTQTHKGRNNARRSGRAEGEGAPKVRSLAEIRETLTYRGMKNHAIPMVEPVQFDAREVPIDPYVLGVLIGDGSFTHDSVSFTSVDREIAELVAGALEETCPTVSVKVKMPGGSDRAPCYRISRRKAGYGCNPIWQELVELGLQGKKSEHKFVPHCYMYNTPEVRLAILQGLMDTDGYVCNAGVTVQFSSSSERLAKDVQFLVNSLGGNATIKSKIPTFCDKNGEKKSGLEHYTVHMRLPADIMPFRLKRKVDRVKPKSKYIPTRYITGIVPVGRKPAQCIMVDHPSHLYVTDDFIVTHNTLGGLLLARMAKLQGSAQKPIIVVPKSVLANWYAESQAWFPGARVLTIGADFQSKNGELVGKDDSAAERKRKYHDLTQNDYDFIIISEPAFEEIDLDPITKEQYYSQDFWVQRGEAMGNAGDKRRKAIKERYEQALASREFQDRTDAIYFNDLGIDMLIADEAHHQKNLYAARARFGESPKFLGGQGLSNRALDFNLKTRWVREHNGGKGVHGLTATPTKNSPLEIYSMLSHIAPEAFERIGVRNSEEFLDRFCEFTQDKVLSTAGDIEDALVVSGFKNLSELREIMARFIDRRTAEQVGLELPQRQDRMHLVDMSSDQEAIYAELRALAEESSKKKDATGDSHIFAIMDKMNKAALDLALLDPAKYAGRMSPKYKELAKHAAEGKKDGAQVIFSEYIDSHEKIADALVEAGFDRKRIAIINAKVAGSAVKRQNIADALNAGKLDAVIGNCTMAEGLNLQKTTTDVHHLDIPWEPATLQQRNGRGLRQGNLNEAVRIHSYLSKGSFDGYRYQAVAAKKDWQDLLWNGGDRVENLAREGAFSLDDMRIMLAADPEAAKAAFEADKAAALQRYEAGQRTEAVSEFVRFQDMKRSYGALKNKGSASANRLRDKIEAARASLFKNKYFPAKDALDSDTDVLIHPDTGTVLTAGTGMDFGTDGKMVVTGVNMRAGTVTMRRYADTTGARHVTVPLKEFGDAKPFTVDTEAEAGEVRAKMEEAAAASLNNLQGWDDVKNLPSTVLEANHDLIQRQIKEGAKSYKFRMPYGSVPMVNKETGELKMAESYEHTKMHDTHDYLLPTDAAKERVAQAWMASERGKKFGRESHQARKNSRVEWRNRAEYPDASYNSKAHNPWTSLLRDMHGRDQVTGIAEHPAVRAVRERFEREQLERVRRAPTFKEALAEAFPLAKLPEYGGSESTKPTWNKKALAILWARARHEGLLGSQIDEHLPKQQINAGGREYPTHQSYAHHRPGYAGEDKTVHGTLRDIAAGSGHRDLAHAMTASAIRHHDGLDKVAELRSLSQYNNSDPDALQVMQMLAESTGLTDKKVHELEGFREGLFSTHQLAPDRNQTVRERIAARQAYIQKQKEGA
jgi:hypothetical protein